MLDELGNPIESTPNFLSVGENIVPEEIFEYLFNLGIDKEKAIELFAYIIRENSRNTASPYIIFEKYTEEVDIPYLEYKKRNIQNKKVKDKQKQLEDIDKDILIASFSKDLIFFILYILRFSLKFNAINQESLNTKLENRVPSFKNWLSKDNIELLEQQIIEGNPQHAYEIHAQLDGIWAVADMIHHKK